MCRSHILIILLLLLPTLSFCRRRISLAHRAFEEKDGDRFYADTPGSIEQDGVENAIPVETRVTTNEEIVEETDMVQKLLEGVVDLDNLTRIVEEEHADALDEATNRTVLWIDTSYKALDFNLTVNSIEECVNWQKFWNLTEEVNKNLTSLNETETLIEEMKEELRETELVSSKKRLKILGLNPELLEIYKAVGLVYREICGNHGRVLWYRSREEASRIGVDTFSPICEPFKEELNPDEKTLSKLALTLNALIQNVTDGEQCGNGRLNHTELAANSSIAEQHTESSTILSDSRQPDTVSQDSSSEIQIYDDDIWDYRDMEKRFKVKHFAYFDEHHNDILRRRRRSVVLRTRRKRDTESVQESEEDESEDDWLNVKQIIQTEDGDTTVAIVEESDHILSGNSSNSNSWIEIDASDVLNPSLLISSPQAVAALRLQVDPTAFQRFEHVGLYLPGICSEFVPKAIDEFNSSSFEGVEIDGPIGVNISALELAGVNLTALAEKLRNDTEVDEILSRTNGSTKNLGGSFILPVLNKNQYDPFSAPIVFQGSAVVVRFGIYIESMSNFQTSTMDYDMDIYLMMSWRDARLVNPYDKPILVKEEDILEKIWRPDPFFANAKEAEFHEVTFLNFLMRIFPDGLVLYETRVKIKPSCNLILCKYPHDKQTCDLLIKSFAYPIETVRFEWFNRRKDAIDKNPDVKLPELYIDRYETTTCPNARKSGDFSCLRAVFRLKRDVGFHIAQTYIPTSLALMFSWVGVWLPEEFMEGRIGVAITVLLTLSTESAGAREHLPSVSYLKAIDLWFGFITGFVFFTLLQTLFVIGFDKRANQLRKWAARKTADITEEVREALLQKATRYHKTGRYLDNFCRVFYPLSFILFLFMYYFVFTEGRQDDCMNRR